MKKKAAKAEKKTEPVVIDSNDYSKSPKTAKKLKFVKLKNQPVNPKMLLSGIDKKNEIISSFYKKIENYLFNELSLEGDEEILLGVSGGVDSVVMLDVFANLTQKYYFKINVAHFNHNIRIGSSAGDAEFVRNLAKEYKIPFELGEGNVKQYAKKNSLSIENAARNLRYKFFERTARTYKTGFVATAHTSDDLAETFLINLIRGSGLTGLSSIPPKRQLCKNVLIIRPFLCLTKSEIIEYARLRKLGWREDETNHLTYYTRNKIRYELIPRLKEDYSPAIIDVINRTAKILSGADKFINDKVKKLLKNIKTDKSTDRFSLKISLLQTLDVFLQGEVIQEAVKNNEILIQLPIQTVDRILELIKSPVGAICEVNSGLIVLRDRDNLIFTKRNSSSIINMQIEQEGKFNTGKNKILLKKVNKEEYLLSKNPNIEYFDKDLLPQVLYLRSWESGDVFQPLGMEGKMKVSDLLINKKIPLIDKNNIILLTTRSEIIWVCGIRISDKFKITEETENILKAEFI